MCSQNVCMLYNVTFPILISMYFYINTPNCILGSKIISRKALHATHLQQHFVAPWKENNIYAVFSPELLT